LPWADDDYIVVIVMSKAVGSLAQLLMFAVVRLGDDAHGLAIRQLVERESGRAVSHGALYTTMDRLERNGLVVSWIGSEVPEGGGRRRKLYRLTPEGARALRESWDGLAALAEGALRHLDDAASGS
jgi:PadR family transcriptional regulator PadR